MTLFTATCTLEEKRREKEKDLIGPFLLTLKATLTPELGSSVDTAAKSDRPGVPRRKNSTLRKILQYLKLV